MCAFGWNFSLDMRSSGFCVEQSARGDTISCHCMFCHYTVVNISINRVDNIGSFPLNPGRLS